MYGLMRLDNLTGSLIQVVPPCIPTSFPANPAAPNRPSFPVQNELERVFSLFLLLWSHKCTCLYIRLVGSVE